MQPLPTERLTTSSSGEVVAFGILSEQLDRFWFDVAPLIQKSLDYSDGKYELTDIYRAIANKDMQLWVAYSHSKICGCCVTQIICYPRQKRLFLLFIGGTELDKWIHYIELLKEFAKKNDCVAIEGFARAGWEGKVKQFGFEKIHSVFRHYLKGN